MEPKPTSQTSYRLLGGHCNKCPVRDQCFKTEEFKKMRGERQWKMEGVFAEAKNNHGLDRARYRGKAKMQIQAYMTATVQNLKRLMTLIPEVRVILDILIKNFRKLFFTKKWAEFLSAQDEFAF